MSRYENKNIGYILINKSILINKLTTALDRILTERTKQENIWLGKFQQKYNNQVDVFNKSWYKKLFNLKDRILLYSLEETKELVVTKAKASRDEWGNIDRKYDYKSLYAYYLEDEIYVVLRSAKDAECKEEIELDIEFFTRILSV